MNFIRMVYSLQLYVYGVHIGMHDCKDTNRKSMFCLKNLKTKSRFVVFAQIEEEYLRVTEALDLIR